MRTTLSILLATLSLAACEQKGGGPVAKPSEGATPTPGANAGGEMILQGAGATFPYPLYSKWMAEYQKVRPDVKINYQSIGSGGGIKQITERTVDFGATDAPMKPEEAAKAPGKIVHVPTTIGAVVLAYNLPGVSNLKLTPEIVAGIYLGEITKWNDKKVAEANPGVKLPGDAITVAYRSDGSGTTAVFTEYLASVSPTWKEKVGAGKSVKFPVGLGAKGNEGVSGQVKTTPGTIGYVELAYAKQTNLMVASLKNQSGAFVDPTIESISAAAEGVVLSDDLTASIVNSPNPKAYPIASFTYLLVYEDMQDDAKAKGLQGFMQWALHDGQALGPPLHYAPLPAAVVQKIDARVATLK